jgi:hypothetical protein
LAASLVAGLGLFILPRKRKQSRNEFRRRSGELEQRLVEVMSEQFEHELARSVHRIREAIAPYTRFVRTEQEKLTKIDTDLTAVRSDLRTMRHRIGDPDKLTSGTAAALPAGTVGQNDTNSDKAS